MDGWIAIDETDELILTLLALGVALAVAWIALFAGPAMVLARRLSPQADHPRLWWFGLALIAAGTTGVGAVDDVVWLGSPLVWYLILGWRLRVVRSRPAGVDPPAWASARQPGAGGAPPPPPPPPPPNRR